MAADDGGDTWTVKEVVADLKADIVAHLDKQDVTLGAVARRLDNTATKDDVRELHGRIDGIADRTQSLEDQRKAAEAAASVRSRFRGRAWAVTAAVAVPIGASLILVLVR